MSTPEIAMTPLRESDLEFLRTLRNDKRVSRWLGTKTTITPEMQQEWYFGPYAEDSGWLIFIARDVGEYIGYGQIRGHDDGSYEIGCAVHPDYWQLGYGTAIVEWLLLYVTAGLKSKNVWLWLYASNVIARMLYERCGFKVVRNIGSGRLRMELR